MIPLCSNTLLRIAVPPPQQKFFAVFSPSIVRTGAFHAARRMLADYPCWESASALLLLRQIVESIKRPVNRRNHECPGRPSESAKTMNLEILRQLLDGRTKIANFFPHSCGAPAMTT